MKRVICFLLIACLALAMLASCGGGGEATGETQAPSGEATEAPTGDATQAPTGEATQTPTGNATQAPTGDSTDAPGGDVTEAPATDAPQQGENEYGEATFTSPNDYDEVDMQGETLNIIVRNQTSVQREWYKDTPEDEVDEVIAMRNETVASMINVDVGYTLLGSSNYEECKTAFESAIQEDKDNDFHYYDIAANYAYAGASELLRNYIANIADTTTFPGFDFTLPCWNQAIVNTTMLNGQLYYITGDLNLSTFDKSMVIFINKDVYAEKKGAGDPEDLQDVALEGKWDYEALYKWSSVYRDNDGDTTKSHLDFHGINASIGSIPVDALPYAWDLEYLTEEADGSHKYNVVGNTKIAEAVQKAKDLFTAQGVANWDNTGDCELGGFSEPITHFANDLTVFTLHLLYCTADDNNMLREMSSEFGLLPMPKYTTSQENYGTTSHDAYTLMTVIDHSESSIKTKGEAISYYLQLSSEESYTNVRGYYINEIVKQKYFGLSESVEKSQKIFNIIADNVEFTFISVYAPQLNGILNQCWRDIVTGEHDLGATTAEDAFTLDEGTYNASLENVDSWLGLI